MEDRFIEDSVRARLIEAGLSELLNHGREDFSLRRVAITAQVSCAAPYRHFKDKDELIRAVIAHIREDWLLLSRQIGSVLEVGTERHITELLVAALRFWVAGGNFPSFLAVKELSEFDTPIIESVAELCRRDPLREERRLAYALLAQLYGTVTLVLSGVISVDDAVTALKDEVKILLAADK